MFAYFIIDLEQRVRGEKGGFATCRDLLKAYQVIRKRS